MSETLKRLAELAAKLPDELRADWDGTNHYELTTGTGDDYWWLDVADAIGIDSGVDVSATEEGKRLGLLLDLAEAVSAAKAELKTLTQA